jgi:hypothetical protein
MKRLTGYGQTHDEMQERKERDRTQYSQDNLLALEGPKPPLTDDELQLKTPKTARSELKVEDREGFVLV